MSTKVLPIIFFFFFFHINSIAQDSLKERHHQIGFSFFLLEMNSETIHEKFEPKIVPSVEYSFFRKNIALNALLEYGENLINEKCNCPDLIYGEGGMKEFNTGIGIKYQFGRITNQTFQPFLSFLAYYSNIRYSGNFDGGWSGTGMDFKYQFHSFGGRLSAGLNFFVSKRIGLFYELSCQLAYSKFRTEYAFTFQDYLTGGICLGKFGGSLNF